MSGIPAEIEGIGATSQRLRANPKFDAIAAKIGPQEYFVLSRFDGTTTLKDLLLATGLPAEAAVAIAKKLRSVGAILLPNEQTPPPASSSPPAAPVATRTNAQSGPQPSQVAHGVSNPPAATGPGNGANERTLGAGPGGPAKQVASRAQEPRPVGIPPLEDAMTERRAGLDRAQQPAVRVADLDLSLPSPSPAESAALQEKNDLPEGERRLILALARLVQKKNHWALLGVKEGSAAKELKRAYFRLSKEVHPDRYYGKSLGSFADRLNTVFEAIAKAYAELTAPPKKSPQAAAQADAPQTPTEYAAELFERGCSAEVGGDHANAMKLFAAVVRLDPQVRYLRRAANCALLSEQPRTALEYAKKASIAAPEDPSCARLLAQCFRAVGNLEAAEEVLVMAVALKSENDLLSLELRNELADVRTQLSR